MVETSNPDGEQTDANTSDVWNRYYLGASGIGVVLLTAAALSVPSDLFVAVTILTLFVTLNVCQYRTQVGRHGEA